MASETCFFRLRLFFAFFVLAATAAKRGAFHIKFSLGKIQAAQCLKTFDFFLIEASFVLNLSHFLRLLLDLFVFELCVCFTEGIDQNGKKEV